MTKGEKFFIFMRRLFSKTLGLTLMVFSVGTLAAYGAPQVFDRFTPLFYPLLYKEFGLAYFALPLFIFAYGFALMRAHKSIWRVWRLGLAALSFVAFNMALNFLPALKVFGAKLGAGQGGALLVATLKNYSQAALPLFYLEKNALLVALGAGLLFLCALPVWQRKGQSQLSLAASSEAEDLANAPSLSPLVENLKSALPPAPSPRLQMPQRWGAKVFSPVAQFGKKRFIALGGALKNLLQNFMSAKKKFDVSDVPKPNLSTSSPSAYNNIKPPPPTPPSSSSGVKAEAKDINLIHSKKPPFSLVPSPPKPRRSAQQTPQTRALAEQLSNTLNDFKIEGKISAQHSGPVVSLFEFLPAAGVKSSRIINLADDIARSMSALSARIANIPGQNAIGIEIPNQTRESVHFAHLLNHPTFRTSDASLPLILGTTIAGEPVVADLAAMPHLLVAGTTGSGKSVAINAMILSLLYRLRADECALIMIDPKMLELSVYQNIPHLLAPVVTDPKKAVAALSWVVREMERRYQKMSELSVRSISNYNEKCARAEPNKKMPFIVVIIDEMADLMMVAGKEIEAAVQRLAQMARAAGIHLIAATQRPSVDVITGTIKANFPTRISFQVTSKIDSRTILGEGGAEQLLGKGDMLWMQAGGKLKRVHGPFVSDSHVEHVAQFLRDHNPQPAYLDAVTTIDDNENNATPNAFGGGGGGGGGDDDESLYQQAVELVCQSRRASTSFLQRKLSIGYNRAAKIMERMEDNNIISAPAANGKRNVLVAEEQKQNAS